MSSVRQIAADILCKVEEGVHADRLLESDRRGSTLSPVDVSLLRELVRGVSTWRAHLDLLLAPYLRKPLANAPALLRNLLRMGVYQIRFLDRVPAYAAVSETVDLARKGVGDAPARMVNAVLRGISENRRPASFPDPDRHPVANLAAMLSHPQWMVARWVEQFGLESTRRLCEANNGLIPMGLRVNTAVTTPEALLRELVEEGVEVESAVWPAGYLTVKRAGPLFQTDIFRKGAFSVHGHGAGLAYHLLGISPGDRVLDVCSAPGGKTIAAAQTLAGNGIVVASDLQASRLKRSRHNIRRLRLKQVHYLAADGRHLPFRTTFDGVLVDAPCTATGILSRHPEIRWNRTEGDILALPVQQLALLESAAGAVRPGGVLVYSTCSLEPEENESVIERFLAGSPSFRPDPVPSGIPPETAVPEGRKSDEVSAASMQTFPHIHGCDGAFAVRLVKK